MCMTGCYYKFLLEGRVMCPACADEVRQHDADQNAFSLLCSSDPSLSPGHKEATDAEWWQAAMSGLVAH